MSFTNLGFTEPTPLDPATINVWGATINENFVLIDNAIAGVLLLSVAGNSDVNLTALTGTPDQARNARFEFTGVLTGNITIYYPPGRTQGFSVHNATTGNFTLTIACGTSPTPLGTTVVAPQSGNSTFFSDGTDITRAVDAVGLGLSSATSLGVAGSSQKARMSVTTSSATGTFTADAITVGAALSGPLYTLTAYSKAINLGTVGAGGMDVGTAPVSGYVNLYAIYGVSGSLVSILAQDASGGSPTIYGGTHMPAGYTASALIGIWPTDGSSHFVPGILVGRLLSYAGTGVGSVGLTWTSISIATAVPPAAITVSGSVSASALNPVDTTAAYVASVGTGTAAGIGQFGCSASNVGGVGTTATAQTAFSGLALITAQTIYSYVSNVKTTGVIKITGYTF